MVIDKTSWHAKLYQWWHFRKHGRNADYVNLCPYVRVVLLWCWLRWLLGDGRIGRIRVPFIVWGYIIARIPFWIGIFSYEGKKGAFIIYGYAAVFALAIWLGERADERRKRLGYVAPKPSSFRRVLVERAKAMHDGICPVVEIR